MPSSCRRPAELVRRCRPWLGTYVTVAAENETALEVGFAAITRVHGLMSFQDSSSELSALNRMPVGKHLRLHPWTTQVLQRALFWRAASGGTFSAVRGSPEAGFAVEGDHACRTSDVLVDLGGIAKGFAVDRAVEAMIAHGGRAGLVNAGGDLRGFGPDPWQIAIEDPRNRASAVSLQLRDAALATSARARDAVAQGRHWGCAGERLSASVQCATAVDADALAKVVLAGAPAAPACLREASAEALVLTPEGWRELSRAGADL